MANLNISATTAANSFSNLNEVSRTPVTTLDQDDFLKLLVTQMTTQDPLKPMEDLSSFSQLASFSALEQNKATQASMAVIQANSMLGHFVQVAGEYGQPMVGQVEQVLMIEGQPQVVVDGERFTLDKISAISVIPFLVDEGGGGSSSQPPNTTTPAPETLPQLGAPPSWNVDPTLGTAPIDGSDPILGVAPLLSDNVLIGRAPRF